MVIDVEIYRKMTKQLCEITSKKPYAQTILRDFLKYSARLELTQKIQSLPSPTLVFYSNDDDNNKFLD
jgi:hypothetical protein